MSDNAKLTHGSIAGHLFKQTAPVIVGIAAIMSVGIIDAYFLGQLGGAELAAISFIFPVTTALSSIGVGVIAGVSSVVSRALGADDLDKAKRRGNLGVVLGLVVGLVVAGLLYVLRKPLFELMQADDNLLPLIDSYMVVFALGFPLLLSLMGMNGVLRGQGAAKRATAILLSFSVANWFLDPLLINGGFGIEGMGVAGAAWATVIGWAIGLVVAIICMQSSQITIEPSRLTSCNLAPASWSLARVAGPAAFSNAINPVGLSVLTAFLAAEGQDAVAGYGAGGRLQTFAVVPLLGLSSSIGAIVGQNWGAGREDRARTALIQSGLFCIGYGLLIAVLLYAFRFWFAGLFSESQAVVDETARYLELAVWGYAAYGLLIVVNGALNAIDRATTALVLSAGRVLLVMVPFAALLQPSLGADAVYAAELACNIAGALAACFILYFIFDVRAKSVAKAAAT